VVVVQRQGEAPGETVAVSALVQIRPHRNQFDVFVMCSQRPDSWRLVETELPPGICEPRDP